MSGEHAACHMQVTLDLDAVAHELVSMARRIDDLRDKMRNQSGVSGVRDLMQKASFWVDCAALVAKEHGR